MKDENGIDARARDGEPDAEQRSADDELAQRRRKQEASDAAAAAAMGGKSGRAIDDQDPDDDEPELFPMGSIPGDHKVTMKNIVPPAKARKTEAKMRATPVPMLNGLRHYGELVELLVTVEAGKVEEVPDLDEPEAGGRRILLGVKDVQHFRPVHVGSAEGMLTTEQVIDLLEAEFGVPWTADKIAEVFGPAAPARAAAAK